MMMGVTAEQQELREAVRRFLTDRAPLPRVRELMETDDGTDAEVWRQAGAQLGLQGIAIPEEYGGVRVFLSHRGDLLPGRGLAPCPPPPLAPTPPAAPRPPRHPAPAAPPAPPPRVPP